MRYFLFVISCFVLLNAMAPAIPVTLSIPATSSVAVVPTVDQTILVSGSIVATLSAVTSLPITAASSIQSQRVTIVTSKGKFICELYPSAAPKTVENFLKLSKDGFYNGLKFHRVIPGFVAQGGDPLTRGIRDKDWTTNTRIAYSKGIPLAGTGGPGYTIKAEFNNLHHEPGTLAMARSQDPDSAGSQFYICLAPQPHLDGNYTVFGKVTDGMDVVLALQVGDEIQSISVYPVEPVVTPVTVNAVNNNQ